MSEPTSGWPGSRCAGSPSRATRGWPALVGRARRGPAARGCSRAERDAPAACAPTWPPGCAGSTRQRDLERADAARHPVRRPGRRRVAGTSSTTSMRRRAAAGARRAAARAVGAGAAAGSTSSTDAVAVVGSRSATTYGAEVAGEHRRRPGPRRGRRGVGCGVRHRPGRPPRRAGRRRGRRSRCWPAASTGPTRPPTASLLDHLADDRRGGRGAAARAARRPGCGS